MEDYAIVYQCGIANVFRTGAGVDYRRVLQTSFRLAEAYCAGLREAGKSVGVFHCDAAGDVSTLAWDRGPGEMFAADKTAPAVWSKC